MTVLRMRITCKQKCDRNVCELWIGECAFFDIISLHSSGLITLRSAIRMRDQMHRRMRLPRPKTRKKRTVTRLARRLACKFPKYIISIFEVFEHHS